MAVFIKLGGMARPGVRAPLGRVHIGQLRGAANRVHPGYGRLKKIQKRFQVDDGRPVHLKKGLPDIILCWSTTALAVVGVAWGFKDLLGMVYPPQDDADEE